MVLLNNHEKIVVKQREELGCIPSGYEWMIRFAKIEDVDLNNFQEEFNLQERGLAKNSFMPIGDAIQKKYPQIKIEVKDFINGQEKIEFIKNLIMKQNPCLISMPTANLAGYHIQPITGFDNGKGIFYAYNPISGIAYEEVLKSHNCYLGGHDISWIALNKAN